MRKKRKNVSQISADTRSVTLSRTASRKKQFALLVVGVSLMAGVLNLMTVGRATTEDSSTFLAHYEHRAQIGAELLARAQSVHTDQAANTAAMMHTVTVLNQEITSLYTLDETLSAEPSHHFPVARIASGVRHALEDAQAGASLEVKAYTSALQQPSTRTKPWVKGVSVALKSAQAMQRDVAVTTQTVNSNIGLPTFRTSIPLQMDALQSAIEQIQATTIDMLNATLWLGDPAWVNAQPTTISGLGYSLTSVRIPAKAQAPVMDSVGVQPQVSDASGQPLPQMGTYRIAGPLGGHGVNIDSLTGTVTVRQSAIPGSYTVIYKQGTVSEQSVIQVVASK